MKKLYYSILLGLVAFFSLQSCDNQKTYGELVDEENAAIKTFIAKNDIKVISLQQFVDQDSINTDSTEYVYFEDTGVYMNVLHRGDGKEVLKEGSHVILSRFMEVSIADVPNMGLHAGDTILRNMYANGFPGLYLKPEEYEVTLKDNTYVGKFQGTSLMFNTYENMTAVPAGWLLPLRYVKPIRTSESEKWARVKLIVPHSEGTTMAMRFVYPCFYELTYNLDH